jgi:hypothetical protein
MPGLNQTGPSGQGPKTGRGRGFCNTGRPICAKEIRNYAGFGNYADFGQGLGFGRGFRCGFGRGTSGYSGKGLGRNRKALLQVEPEDTQIELDRISTQVESIRRSFKAFDQRLTKMEKSE